MTMRKIRPLALLGATLLFSKSLIASPLMEHTGALMGQGGHNARFTQSGPASAYFNPAFLTQAQTGVTVGTFVLADRIRVTLGSREGLGVDVPEYPDGLQFEYEGRTTPFDRQTVPTRDLYLGCAIDENPCLARPRQGAGSSNRTRGYALVGLVNQIAGPQLVAGVYAMLPMSQYTTARSFFVDEREQFFSNSLHPELFADRLTAPSLAVGIGSQVFKRLSLGISFTIALQNRAAAGVYVPDAGNQKESLLLTTDVAVTANTAMHLGATYELIDGLTLSATGHSPSRFGIVTEFANLLPNGDEQVATRSAVHDFMPWLFGLGAEYSFRRGLVDYAVVGGATLGLWSSYLNRQGERPSAGYEWKDTVSPSVGFRAERGPVRILSDIAYQPTPVPVQTGRTNYVDNDRLRAAIGGELQFDLWGHKLALGANVQGHLLLRRNNPKITPDTASANANPLSPHYREGVDPSLIRDELPDDLTDALRPGRPYELAQGLQTNNPGYPGFESDGFLVGAGLYLKLHY